jgi:hypothetical protein
MVQSLPGFEDHPELKGTGAMKAVIKFGLLHKPDGKQVYLGSVTLESARIEPDRQLIIVPDDFGTYLQPINNIARG